MNTHTLRKTWWASLSLPVSFLHITFYFQRHPRCTEAQVCVCFHTACLWIQAQMRHDKLLHPPLRSSVVGPSALPFSSSFHRSFLFFHTFSLYHRWKQDKTGNEREQALIREGGLGQRDWNNKTFKTGNSNLGGLETRLTGGRFLFLHSSAEGSKEEHSSFNCLVSMFFFVKHRDPLNQQSWTKRKL